MIDQWQLTKDSRYRIWDAPYWVLEAWRKNISELYSLSPKEASGTGVLLVRTKEGKDGLVEVKWNNWIVRNDDESLYVSEEPVEIKDVRQILDQELYAQEEFGGASVQGIEESVVRIGELIAKTHPISLASHILEVPKETARRYNGNKIRMGLIPPEALEEIAKVYTIGAEKYTIRDDQGNIISDGADNWKKGLPWKQVTDSVLRHIYKFMKGEDFDSDYPPELLAKYGRTLHLANAAWGLFTLIHAYKHRPEFDDRDKVYLKHKNIGLDIDDTVCDFLNPWCKFHNLEIPSNWNFDRAMHEKFKAMDDYPGGLDQFYLDLPVLTEPKDIHFEPIAYVTSRPVSSEVTMKWLDSKGFSAAPVITVPVNTTKVDAILTYNKTTTRPIELFCDDKFENFVELNNAGITCYLFDAPHNQRYDVGYLRIKSLKELM